MARPNMDDYVDVAERLVEFRDKHPDGSLQTLDVQFLEFGGQHWVVYRAAAYRTPDDARPGHGAAWEPVPGRTPFTKDSELQNAETSAWGRAIVAALAADTKRGVASRQEVEARQDAGRERQHRRTQPTQPARRESAPDTADLTAAQRAAKFAVKAVQDDADAMQRLSALRERFGLPGQFSEWSDEHCMLALTVVDDHDDVQQRAVDGLLGLTVVDVKDVLRRIPQEGIPLRASGWDDEACDAVLRIVEDVREVPF